MPRAGRFARGAILCGGAQALTLRLHMYIGCLPFDPSRDYGCAPRCATAAQPAMQTVRQLSVTKTDQYLCHIIRHAGHVLSECLSGGVTFRSAPVAFMFFSAAGIQYEISFF